MKKIIENENLQVVFAFAFFLFMMSFNLMHSSLWGDEWIEYYYSQKSITNSELYNAIISTFQPPLYNFVMHFWLKVSQSLVWFRMFNVIIGLFSAICIYKAVLLLYNRKIGIAVILVWAICYQWVFCVQECSEYTLMLTCLCVALYFYVSCTKNFNYLKTIGFILFSVLAIYSQYGAVFVAVPLMAIYFVGVVFSKETTIKRKIAIFITYLSSFIVFAIPLFIFFASKQIQQNSIADNTVTFTGGLLMDMPFVLGQIIGYMYGLSSGTIWPVIFSIVSVILLSLSMITISNRKVEWVKKSILIALLVGYILHYLFVQLHVYAMTHPGQSAGFFARYSYFYIPIFCLAIPIIFLENGSAVAELCLWKKNVVVVLVACCLSVSFIGVLNNWHKALDYEFMEIWEENEGWNDYTFLYGVNYGFYYYVAKLDQYNDSYISNVSTNVDNDNLPSHFWAWRTNWGGDGWSDTIEKARALGYTVTIYNDSGYTGQLAYCTLEE